MLDCQATSPSPPPRAFGSWPTSKLRREQGGKLRELDDPAFFFCSGGFQQPDLPADELVPPRPPRLDPRLSWPPIYREKKLRLNPELFQDFKAAQEGLKSTVEATRIFEVRF